MAQKPTLPKGTRDFGQTEMAYRNYIFDTIKEVYQLYGFGPIETPSMEMLSTLLGKYGEEGDKLIFRILNSGDFSKNVNEGNWGNREFQALASQICEKGLRYDLTVPFARFVVQHRDEITFPFKRYQIQPVWRADRPQKGRYREFYQCDADVIGSNSLIHEAELIMIMDSVFKKLGINVCIKINNRKILSGIVALINREDLLTDVTVAIDKLEKNGMDEVQKELFSKGLSYSEFEKIKPILLLAGSNNTKIAKMRELFQNIPKALKGLDEIDTTLSLLEAYQTKNNVEFDLSLARGLSYYTGCIFEVKALDYNIGSICGGGRYDNLTGIFGLPDVSGVGISFGADRIYDVLNALNLFPSHTSTSTKAMFVNFGEEETKYCLKQATELRAKGIAVEVYSETAKMKKQISYADARKIPYVIFAGEDEIKNRTLTIKNMTDGSQKTLNVCELISEWS